MRGDAADVAVLTVHAFNTRGMNGSGAQRLERHSVGSASDQRNLFAAANSVAVLLRQEIPPLACGSLRNDNKRFCQHLGVDGATQ